MITIRSNKYSSKFLLILGKEKVPLDSETVPSLFTSDRLLEMGIAHPLHQRRILREVQCFMKSCDGAADSLPAPGLRPSKVRAKPRQLVYEKDMRWPFLDIACVKLATAEKTSSMTSPYGHWRRRMELEAKTQPVPKHLLCIPSFLDLVNGPTVLIWERQGKGLVPCE